MLKIRLQRVGRKNDPSFRVVLTDSRNAAKSGKSLKVLGSYDARRDYVNLEKEEIKSWMSKGAKPSDTMHNLLVSQGVIEGKKINVLPKKKPIAKENTTSDLQQTTQSEQSAEETKEDLKQEEVGEEKTEEVLKGAAETEQTV